MHKRVNNIFVFPNMGDGDYVLTALLSLNKNKNYKKFLMKDMYLGPKFNQITNSFIKKYKVKEIKTQNLENL